MTPEMVAKVVRSTGGKRPISLSVTKTHTKESKVLQLVNYVQCSYFLYLCQLLHITLITNVFQLQVYLPAVTLLAAANFDVRDLEKIWLRNFEELQLASGVSSTNKGKRRVGKYGIELFLKIF